MPMQPVVPEDGMQIAVDTVFEPGVYYLPKGVQVDAGVTLDGGGALLFGAARQGAGVTISGSGATIKNLKLREYYHGLRATEASGIRIAHCDIHGTAELPPNDMFLDIWRGPEESYGAAIYLAGVSDSTIEENDLQHNMNGLVAYGCSGLQVRGNVCSYCSGFGIYLSASSEGTFVENCCDYCCRFQPREGGLHYGHMGADSAGFVLVKGSSRNRFSRNTARMGGDGFFIAGLSPEGAHLGCDDNVFEENDASLSPNIAFECTFSRGNRFVRNFAERSNYGFWLGWSSETVVEDNRIVMNRQAGIAAENALSLTIVGNTFQANGHGVLAWSQVVPSFEDQFPTHHTSRDWEISGNTFTRNGKGIRIAADQDHGIRTSERAGGPSSRPTGFVIRKNDIQDNRIGIELAGADKTSIQENILNRNAEANLRQDDCVAEVFRNNLGAAGAYL